MNDRTKTIPIKRVSFASQARVAEFSVEIQLILEHLSRLTGIPGVVNAWISDESLPSDFGKLDYTDFSCSVGLNVSKGEYIWEIAKRLRQKNSGFLS